MRLWLLLFAISASAAERFPVTRDTWISAHPKEVHHSLGGASKLKLKSMQEMSLVDIDPRDLRGRSIAKATLHVHAASKDHLHRITVSAVASQWTEGRSGRHQAEAGSSCFAYRAYPDTPWAFPGSDLSAVTLGQGGTLWSTADASPPDAKGWQTIAVAPSVIGARVAGISHGFLLFDDTGSEWTREGEKFQYQLFPNRYVDSRHAAGTAPYFSIEFGPDDRLAPRPIAKVAIVTKGLPAGEAIVSWNTPADQGAAAVVGFQGSVNGKPLPQYLLPAPGGRVRLHVRDLDLSPGETVRLAILAVDGAGNRSPEKVIQLRVSDHQLPSLPAREPAAFPVTARKLPVLGAVSVSIIDALDKVSDTGERVPSQPDSYYLANHLWDAAKPRLRLVAARNEFVSFQILLSGALKGFRASLSLPGVTQEFGELRKIAGWPDAVLPLDKPLNASGFTQVLCEVYVPHQAKAGRRQGTLQLTDASGTQLTIAVSLTVWDFTLPDHLSFYPEMNAYGLPENERDYYRLAHRHRTPLNRVPYGQNGKTATGGAPVWKDGKLDFSAWEKRFGPYLDGSAFADLPRQGVPLACFYLPLHENWPTAINDHYNGDYWAERAFSSKYREAFVAASREFAAHASRRGWLETRFHCYQNNKVNFKRDGWSRGSSPWLLDEPANWQDYDALRFFATAFHEGVLQAGGKARMLYRGDISRPQWERDSLAGMMGYYVIGGKGFRRYSRLIADRQREDGRINVTYGSGNALDSSNMQAVGWCLDAWTRGADGVIPWQSIGRAESWQKPDRLSLFYPGPVPSIRLKAFRRGQQDVEYLTLLGQELRQPRWAIGQRVREALSLRAVLASTGFAGEDAGVMHYSQLSPQAAWRLRLRVGMALSKARPTPRDRLVDLRTPHARFPQNHFVGPVRRQPKWRVQITPQERAKLVTTAVLLQGRGQVRDAIISPGRPQEKLGQEARSNRVARNPESTAMLMRFALKPDAYPPGRLLHATLRFYVWDPSGKGRAKVRVAPLKSAWTESEVSFGSGWAEGAFDFAKDASVSPATVIVEPNEKSDVVEPPDEYAVDVTTAVRAWLRGAPNHGFALVTEADRAVDEGHYTRFQVYASEHRDPKVTPSLTLEFSGP